MTQEIYFLVYDAQRRLDTNLHLHLSINVLSYSASEFLLFPVNVKVSELDSSLSILAAVRHNHFTDNFINWKNGNSTIRWIDQKRVLIKMNEINKFIARYDVDEWKDQYHKCRARSWLVPWGQVSVIFTVVTT